MTWLMQAIGRRRTRRWCFHHDRRTGESWIRDRIIDWRKRYDCKTCGKVWVI